MSELGKTLTTSTSSQPWWTPRGWDTFPESTAVSSTTRSRTPSSSPESVLTKWSDTMCPSPYRRPRLVQGSEILLRDRCRSPYTQHPKTNPRVRFQPGWTQKQVSGRLWTIISPSAGQRKGPKCCLRTSRTADVAVTLTIWESSRASKPFRVMVMML